MSEQSAAWEYKEESPLREAWKMYLQNRAAELGLVLLGAVLLLTCVGPLVYPVDPFEMVAPPMSAPGEYGLICGSDYLGRDIFAGIIAGGKATMAVGGFATLVTLCIGITIGALAGYRQGIWDEHIFIGDIGHRFVLRGTRRRAHGPRAGHRYVLIRTIPACKGAFSREWQ